MSILSSFSRMARFNIGGENGCDGPLPSFSPEATPVVAPSHSPEVVRMADSLSLSIEEVVRLAASRGISPGEFVRQAEEAATVRAKARAAFRASPAGRLEAFDDEMRSKGLLLRGRRG